MNWIEKYVGIPYARFNCAQLVAEVIDKEFGLTAQADFLRGKSTVAENDRPDTYRANTPIVAERIEAPVNGCGVILVQHKHPAHMGLVIETSKGFHVLHATREHGSVVEPLRMPKYRIGGFYKWKTMINNI